MCGMDLQSSPDQSYGRSILGKGRWHRESCPRLASALVCPRPSRLLEMDNRRTSLQNGRQERKRASSPYARPASPATRAPAATPVSSQPALAKLNRLTLSIPPSHGSAPCSRIFHPFGRPKRPSSRALSQSRRSKMRTSPLKLRRKKRALSLCTVNPLLM